MSTGRDSDVVRLSTSPDWREHANCRGHLHLFFAKKAERPEARARREAKAKQLCDDCPVFEECRSFARSTRQYGYWAGESELDRHLLGFHTTAPIGLVSVRPATSNETAPDDAHPALTSPPSTSPTSQDPAEHRHARTRQR